MYKLIEPANQIVRKKKRQFEKRQSHLNQENLSKKKTPEIIESSFLNDQNYDIYCILVYDFFKLNSEEIKATNQLQTYIERGEGKE